MSPAGNATPLALTSKPGTYNEIVYGTPTKPFVTVSGLDRDRTIIHTPQTNFNVAPVQNGSAPSDNYCIQRRIPGTPIPLELLEGSVRGPGVRPHDPEHHSAQHYAVRRLAGGSVRGNNDRILLDRVSLLSFQDTLRIYTSGFLLIAVISR